MHQATLAAIAFAALSLVTTAQAKDWTGAYGGLVLGHADSGDKGIFRLGALPPGGALETAFSPNRS